MSHYPLTRLLTSIVNLSPLPRNLQDAQQAQISRMEADMRANYIHRREFEAQMQALNARVSHMEEAVHRWTSAWQHIEEAANQIDAHAARITELTEASRMKADLSDFAQFKAEMKDLLDERNEILSRDKASAQTVQELEDSQHRILEEVLAMQRVIACKVDRVEIPLLNASAEKLQRAVAFQEQANQRLKALEEAAVTTSQVLAQKEDKEAIVHRMQLIHRELANRPDLSWLNSRVVDPVDVLQKDVAQLLQTQNELEATIVRIDALGRKIETVDQIAEQSAKGFERLERTLRSALEEMRTKPSLQLIQQKFEEQTKAVDTLLRQQNEKTAADLQIQTAYTADLRAQMLTFAKHIAEMEKKLSVALRFVQWFADMKSGSGGLGSIGPTGPLQM